MKVVLGYIGYHLNLTLPSKDQSSDDHFTARRRLRRKRIKEKEKEKEKEKDKGKERDKAGVSRGKCGRKQAFY